MGIRRLAVVRDEVPERFFTLAKDRCDAIKLAWTDSGTSGIDTLIASCYLQGVADMVTAGDREDARIREQITCRSGGAD